MQLFTNGGLPAAGYQLFCYEAGTTTKLDTYSDSDLTVPNANPIVLDSAGRATVFLQPLSYKFVFASPTDTDPPTSPIWTVDNISAPTAAVSPVLSGSVTIDSNTSTPALKITQTGVGPALRVQDSADPDATPFLIDSTGQVGIGTAAPSAA